MSSEFTGPGGTGISDLRTRVSEVSAKGIIVILLPALKLSPPVPTDMSYLPLEFIDRLEVEKGWVASPFFLA